MTSKTIGQLPEIITPAAADKILAEVSSTGATGYIRFDKFGTGGGGTTGTNYIDITKSPYNADNTNTNDCSSALISAMGSGGKTIFFPVGTYRFNSSINIPAGTVLLGAGSYISTINLTGNSKFIFQRNTNGAYNLDWTKSALIGLQITSSTADTAVLVDGNEIKLEDLLFCGGSSTSYCIDLLDCRNFSLHKIAIGTGEGGFTRNGNGIRVRVSRGSTGVGSGDAVNYGSGVIDTVVIHLNSTNSTGISIDASGYNPSSSVKPVIENVTVSNVYIFSSSKPSGCRGLYLKQVNNCAFFNIQFKNLVQACVLESLYSNGNSGSNMHNLWVKCFARDCDDGWHDGTANSLWDSFVSCYNIGPKDPYGTELNDYSSKRAPWDWIIPSTLWLSTVSSGQPKMGFKATESGALYILGDIDYQKNSGQNYDGMPKYVTPRKALAINFPDVDTVHLFRTSGGASEDITRILIGNGENFSYSGSNINKLHHIGILDPLYIKSSSQALPSNYNTSSYPFIIANASNASVVQNTPHWNGPGLYVNTPYGESYSWTPLGDFGKKVVNASLVSSNHTLDITMANKNLIFTYSSTSVTFNIPADVLSSTDANPNSNYFTAIEFFIFAQGHDVVINPYSGVTLYLNSSTTPITNYAILKNNTAHIIYYRTGAGTATIRIVMTSQIDGGAP
ncbi:MAG: glycosyl hydrolase family 28-related protein [Sulfolobales archaeon]